MKCSPLLAVYHKSKLPKCNIPNINCHFLVILVITAYCCQINWVNLPMDVIWMWNLRSVTKYVIYCHFVTLSRARYFSQSLGWKANGLTLFFILFWQNINFVNKNRIKIILYRRRMLKYIFFKLIYKYFVNNYFRYNYVMQNNFTRIFIIILAMITFCTDPPSEIRAGKL